jgi:hypothetical protein
LAAAVSTSTYSYYADSDLLKVAGYRAYRSGYRSPMAREMVSTGSTRVKGYEEKGIKP